MWLCFNDGFVSVVNDKLNINELVVRSRRPEILEELFPEKQIKILTVSDYKYRVYCSKAEMSKIIVDRIGMINYSNFKDSVDDEELHDLYSDMWSLHYRYQE
jgi:hypothetical protein